MQTTPAPSLSRKVPADDNAGAVDLFALARDLFARLTGGHDGLGFNVRGVPSVTAIGPDGKRGPVLLGYGQGGDDDDGRAWRPARELVQVAGDRLLVPRVLTPQTVAAHVRGRYSVAVEAAGWVEWLALDIDAHAVEADGADGPRLAKARARRVLGQVLAALGCGGDRWPVLLRSPGGGFHVWIPITRGVGTDHRWPAAWASSWLRHHLASCGVELRDGVCEVYPSGRRLRAPCGRGSVLLRVVREDVTDPLALEPWPGTFSTRTLWSQGGDPQLVRRPGPMLAACLGEWERQRRTIADWTGRPEAAWDPDWGFLGRRGDEKQGPAVPGTYDRSQQVDDVSDAPPGRGSERVRNRPALVVLAGGGAGSDRGSLLSSPASFSKSPTGAELASHAGEVEGAAVSSLLVKGSGFWRKVHRLNAEGVTVPGTRHDAVLTLCFAWGAAAGLSDDETIGRLVTWCGAHAHAGSRLGGSGAFTSECVREAAHYLRTRGPRWPFRGAGRGSAVSLGVLVEADRRVLELVDARVRIEAGAVLAFLAGRADDDGTVSDPVEWAASLAARLLGDRRVVDGGKRRRAAVVAVEELARLGFITRHSGHAVGRHGRRWSVWYRFGSGELAARVTIDRASWERAGRREVLVPSLAMAAPVIVQAAQEAPGATNGAAVEVREVATRPVREGVLRALSADGGPVRLVLVPGTDAPAPARPGYRAAWWLRQWRGAPTVGAFASAHEGAIVIAPRRTAAEGVARLVARGGALVTAWPSAGGPGAAAGSYDPEPAVPVAVVAELAAELPRAVELYAGPGDAAGAVAPDLAAALGRAWAAWERSQTEKDPGSGTS